jgi:tryptophanyl-tRNA synthetase
MIADLQALTDHADRPQVIREHIAEVALDYLSVGLAPEKNTFFVQSLVPEFAELTLSYLNLVSTGRLRRNPTVKAEIAQKNFAEGVPAGFFMYPVSQAADITGIGAKHVPVGEEQLPMIEQTNEIVRKFQRYYGAGVVQECRAILSEQPRLCGTDGGSKMGKTIGNAIFLKDDEQTVRRKVMSMFTDPNHIHKEDPGQVDGNPVFIYLDSFDPEKASLADLKEHYRRGGLGDVTVKERLVGVLESFLQPIRERRKHYASDMGEVHNMLRQGSDRARQRAAHTLTRVKAAMGLYGY